jgi:hypothetical protein
MKLSVLDNTLWAAGLIGHVALLVILLSRKTLKGFGLFKARFGFKALLTVALFLVSRHGSEHAYFLFYWIGGYVDYAIQFAIIVVLARNVLSPVTWWLRENRNEFAIWGSLAVVAAIAVSLGVGRPGLKGFNLWENHVSVFLLITMCGMLLVVASTASFFHLYRRQHVLAIGNGLFVISYSVLLQDLADVIFAGNRGNVVASYISMFFYLAVLVYWIVTFWRPEKEPPPLSPEMQARVVALHEQVQYDLKQLNGPRQ